MATKRQPRVFARAYGNCRCLCHRTTGVLHIMPCCIPSDEDTVELKDGTKVDLRAPWPFPISIGTKEPPDA